MSKSKSKSKPWDKNWETLKDIGGGGQGKTSLVKPKNDSFLAGKYVLKILKEQKDDERRARMYREVTNIRTLRHTGIPKLIDSNYEFFEDLNIPLYMVTEFIKGSTLEEFVAEGVMNVFDAVRFTLKLLDILEYCHQRDIVHRDIKPDNIIIRKNHITTPVLIDFGLSFNKENDTSLTPTEQDIGNRFLVLPEHKRKSGLQRDPRSDITQVCGILFFVITGEIPRHLYDEKGNKPHQNQRREIQQNLSILPQHILSQINRVFDTAFEYRIDYRWQSIPALRNTLINIVESENQEPNKTANLLDEIKYKASSNEEKKLFRDISKKIISEVFKIVERIVQDFDSDFCVADKGRADTSRIYHDWENLRFRYTSVGTLYGGGIDISYSFSNELFSPAFEGYITGNEVILLGITNPSHRITGSSDEEKIELLRTPLSGEPDFTGFDERLKDFYVEGINRIM
ncbi:MAG: serine/threonine-protein kinase [Cyanobacteriota bacterium]|nr:serine/threonine-protein kinase [Cyanobacteriota bacterium]